MKFVTNLIVFTSIFLHSCITKSKYEKVLSSKERISRSLIYTENELKSLRERTSVILDKFEQESQNINNLTIRVNALSELIKADSVEISRYKIILSDFQDRLKISNEKNTQLTTDYEQKIQTIIVKYNSKISYLNRKLRKEKIMYRQLYLKLRNDNEQNVNSMLHK